MPYAPDLKPDRYYGAWCEADTYAVIKDPNTKEAIGVVEMDSKAKWWVWGHKGSASQRRYFRNPPPRYPAEIINKAQFVTFRDVVKLDMYKHVYTTIYTWDAKWKKDNSPVFGLAVHEREHRFRKVLTSDPH